MARCTFQLTLKNSGRITFGFILVVQAIFLACYPGEYEHCKWYSLFTVFLPAFGVWSLLLCFRKATLRLLLLVWGLYIVALIVNIGIIFGLVGDKLGTKKFPSLGLLKGILCLTPALLLLLLHNADDLATLNTTLKTTLPSFTLNTTVISKSELTRSLAIPPVFGGVMIGVACFSLLLSIWQWAENKLSSNDPKIQFRTAVARNVLEVIFVNFFFLIIRGVVFFKYGQDDFVFIAKNFIAIIFSILEIHSLCQLHSKTFICLCKEEWRKFSTRLRTCCRL